MDPNAVPNMNSEFWFTMLCISVKYQRAGDDLVTFHTDYGTLLKRETVDGKFRFQVPEDAQEIWFPIQIYT